MAKKNKKDKELDIILEQLKKSYGTEPSDVTDSISDESSAVEEDLELNTVLAKLFSDVPQTIEPKSEDNNIKSEVESEDETIDFETFDENETEDENIELEAFDENETEDENIELEAFDEDEAEDETIDFETFDEDEAEDENIELESSDENETEDENIEIEPFNKDEYLEDIEPYNTEESNYISTEFNDIEILDNLEPEFAVEDEEYDVISCSVSDFPTTSFDAESEIEPSANENTDKICDYISDDISSNPHNELSENFSGEPSFEEIFKEDCENENSPLLILDPNQYTHDTLQDCLPKFKTISDRLGQFPSDSEAIEKTAPAETEDFDNNDLSLLLKLGYDDEIKSKVGGEKTQKVIWESNQKFRPEDNQSLYGFCGHELTGRNQIPKITEKYKLQKRLLSVTLASIFILFLMILSITIYFDTYSSRLNSFPILLLMEFILISVIAVILYKKLIAGTLGIIKLVPDQYSVLSFVLAIYVLYDVSALINYSIAYESISPSELTLIGSCVALYALLTVAADLLNCIKEASTFELISSSDVLFAAEKVTSNYVDPAHSEETTYQIRQTPLISGYFKKTAKSRAPFVNLIYVLGVVPLFALIIGCIFAISSGSIMSGISSATITIMLCIPLSCVCLFSLNEYIISKKLKADKLAFIGYDAIVEYSKVQNLRFKDRDVILVTSYSEIHPQTLHGQNALEIAHEIFNALNGTIAEYRSAIENHQKAQASNIVINGISDNGIDISYASSTNILFGDKSYMRAHNIKVKTDSSLYGATKGSDRSVLYMAFDGIPKLGFILGGRISTGFIKAVKELDKYSVKVFVESYEPHVNDFYFEQNTEESLSIEVLKPQTHEPYTYDNMQDSNVVFGSNAFDLARVVPISKQIIHQRKICKWINYGLILTGFILSCLLAFSISSRASLAFFEFIKLHRSMIMNFILAIGLVPGLIAILHFQKNKTKTKPTTTQNGDKNKK